MLTKITPLHFLSAHAEVSAGSIWLVFIDVPCGCFYSSCKQKISWKTLNVDPAIPVCCHYTENCVLPANIRISWKSKFLSTVLLFFHKLGLLTGLFLVFTPYCTKSRRWSKIQQEVSSVRLVNLEILPKSAHVIFPVILNEEDQTFELLYSMSSLAKMKPTCKFWLVRSLAVNSATYQLLAIMKACSCFPGSTRTV